jgi:hypothetical protein
MPSSQYLKAEINERLAGTTPWIPWPFLLILKMVGFEPRLLPKYKNTSREYRK